MPRFYVKNKEDKWNVFSTIVDDFLYYDFSTIVDDFLYYDWLSFEDLVEVIVCELVKNKKKELKTLLTDKPELNVMSYDEAMRKTRKAI